MKVFISHAHTDESLVKKVAAVLEDKPVPTTKVDGGHPNQNRRGYRTRSGTCARAIDGRRRGARLRSPVRFLSHGTQKS